MGKNSSNPLNTVKTFINNTGDTVSQTYADASNNVYTVASQIITPNIISDITEPKPTSQPIPQPIPQSNSNLTPFEEQIQSLYIGCFSDDPSNPSMEKDLGDVSNSLECIDLGKKNNYKYIGIQQGNKCFASNQIPIAPEVSRTEHCNIGCDDINTGNCGGFFYNQVYKTDVSDNILKKLSNLSNLKNKDDEKNKEATNMLENFINLDKDIEKINYGLSNVNCNCLTPVNSYILFFWTIVLILLLYLLFEYIYNKTQKNI